MLASLLISVSVVGIIYGVLWALEPSEFVLHDGEDDEKTGELHRFMDGARIYDWEGCNSGIIVYPTADSAVDNESDQMLMIDVGDTILRSLTGNISVRKKEKVNV